MFRKQALYEQVGFDRHSASWHMPQEIAHFTSPFPNQTDDDDISMCAVGHLINIQRLISKEIAEDES